MDLLKYLEIAKRNRLSLSVFFRKSLCAVFFKVAFFYILKCA